MWRRRTAALLVGLLALLLVANPVPALFWAGVPFVAVGETVRAWAAGYLTKLSRLVTAGPFALCRNPIYIGSFLVNVGYLFMCNQPAAWVAGLFIFWIFHAGAVAYEEKLLREKFGIEFDEYRSAVPCFVPKMRSLSGRGSFSLKQLAANDEIRVALGTFGACVLFGLMAYGIIPRPLAWLSGAVMR